MNFLYKPKIFSINPSIKHRKFLIKSLKSNKMYKEYYDLNYTLNQDKLEELTVNTIKESWTDNIPGKTETEKKEWCIRKLNLLFETFDNFIPVVGVFLDNPFVDDLQTDAVRLLVEKLWISNSPTSSNIDEK